MKIQSVNELVEVQGRRWASAVEHPKRPRKPCIALSRQPFSGATEIGERLALRLDYGFFAHEIVDEIAREEGIRKDLVAGLDEHLENAIERHVLDGFRSHGFTESDYLRDLLHVVSTLGHRGMAVILGRGASYILPPEQALRVLVVAAKPFRTARLAAIHHLDASEAARRLDREDRRRVEFCQHHFHVDYQDPALYDLVVNSESLTIEGAIDVIVHALHRRFPETVA